ncbi:MAG: hypothetical protein R2874_00690 [Desulfobacterales bacterium]
MPIGSLLIKMGFCIRDDMLDFLSQKFGVPAINIFEQNIPQDTINMIPLDKIKQYKILPISYQGNILTLGMVNLGLYDHQRSGIYHGCRNQAGHSSLSS